MVNEESVRRPIRPDHVFLPVQPPSKRRRLTFKTKPLQRRHQRPRCVFVNCDQEGIREIEGHMYCQRHAHQVREEMAAALSLEDYAD